MKETKIICTLGPASTDKDVMKDMLAAGMNVARLNFSHGSHEEHLGKINTFRQACEEMGVPAAILLDTKGPEIRLGAFAEEPVELEKGQTFTLKGDKDAPGTKEGVGISYEGLAEQVTAGINILIDDGKIRLAVEDVKDGDIICRVAEGGPVSTKKGVNVPDVHLNMDYLSERDKSDLLFGISQDVDFVAASFVRSADDVKDIRTFLDENGGENIELISKIENPEGVRNFDEILEGSDGIMIARGDMGVEVDFATLPGIQKTFIDKCNCAGKPVITATQMLESMIEETMPTRAEITDVANAVFDGTSAVMLSGESAAGKFPARTVEVMSRILNQAESDLQKSPRGKIIKDMVSEAIQPGGSDISTAIGHAACKAADDVGAKAIIAITYSGYTARVMSRFHPDQPIVAATPTESAYRKLALTRGVYPVKTDSASDWDQLLSDAVKRAAHMGFVSSGDCIVISAGIPLNVPGNTNAIRIERVDLD